MTDSVITYNKMRDVIDIVVSLNEAVQKAGGVVSKDMLEMSLSQFIIHVAAPNKIRFVCEGS